MDIPKWTNHFYDTRRWRLQIRVYHHTAKGKKRPHYLFKCDCYEEK